MTSKHIVKHILDPLDNLSFHVKTWSGGCMLIQPMHTNAAFYFQESDCNDEVWIHVKFFSPSVLLYAYPPRI